MRSVALAISVGLPLVVAATVFDAKMPSAEEVAVRSTVEAYFEGMMQANPAALRRAFHPQARLMGLRSSGEVMVIPFDRWARSWDGRDPRDPERYVNTIVTVDIAGTAASVKTDLAWPDVHYVDYLNLLQVNGEWKIVNKIWWEEPAP